MEISSSFYSAELKPPVVIDPTFVNIMIINVRAIYLQNPYHQQGKKLRMNYKHKQMFNKMCIYLDESGFFF